MSVNDWTPKEETGRIINAALDHARSSSPLKEYYEAWSSTMAAIVEAQKAILLSSEIWTLCKDDIKGACSLLETAKANLEQNMEGMERAVVEQTGASFVGGWRPLLLWERR
jgi:hypothetical protein